MNILELLTQGFLFGWIDNGIVCASIWIVAWVASRGLSPEARSASMKIAIGCALVASLGNATSDFVGALGDPTMWDSITGITAGCLSWSLFLACFHGPTLSFIMPRRRTA